MRAQRRAKNDFGRAKPKIVLRYETESHIYRNHGNDRRLRWRGSPPPCRDGYLIKRLVGALVRQVLQPHIGLRVMGQLAKFSDTSRHRRWSLGNRPNRSARGDVSAQGEEERLQPICGPQFSSWWRVIHLLFLMACFGTIVGFRSEPGTEAHQVRRLSVPRFSRSRLF